MSLFIDRILIFVVAYPIVMSFIWIFGGVGYEIKKRLNERKMKDPLIEQNFTIVIPVYNEETTIEQTLRRNLQGVRKNYPNSFLWVINDCSTDGSKEILDRFEGLQGVKITHLEKNLGKAKVLNYALKHIKTKYFICVDSDTYIYPNALNVLNRVIYNEKDSKVSSYTGSLTVNQQDGSSAILKIQKLEYRSIIGTIKRTQDFFFNNLMTVSGALTCYDVKVVRELGGFCTDSATEDIEMTWRMTAAGYQSRFIDNFCAEIFSPSNGYELIKQRIRWNLGGLQTAKKYRYLLFKKKFHAARAFQLDRLISIFWVYAFLITTLVISSELLFGFPENFDITMMILPTSMLLFTSIGLQIISYLLDKNEKEFFDEFLVLILYYPLAYWLVQPSGYFSSVWKYYFSKAAHGQWRRTGSYNIRLRSVVSAIADISIYFFLISLWKVILEASIVLFPKSIITIYYLLLVFWMGLALVFFQYFISAKYSTLSENLVGLKSKRKRNIIQSILSPIPILIMTNTVFNSYVTINILSITDFNLAVSYIRQHISSGGIINDQLYWFYVIVLIERFFGITKKIIRNPLVKIG